METVLITGNTYPVRDELSKLGGVWDSAVKGWRVPKEAEAKAKALVAGAKPAEKKELTKADRIAIAVRKRGGTPGKCSSCGVKVKYPYDLCFDCKEERDMGY